LLQSNVDGQPPDTRGLSAHELDRLIISSICIDGVLQVLSQYGDDGWQLSGGLTNRRMTEMVISFSILPSSFRDVVKAICYRYIRRGRGGRSPPKALTILRTFREINDFLQFLVRRKVLRLAAVTPFVCSLYVDECRKSQSKRGALRSAGYLTQLFAAVELLHELSQFTNDAMPKPPWEGTSCKQLGGLTGGGKRTSKTPLMTDEVFTALFQHAWRLVERADRLLTLRDELEHIVEGSKTRSKSKIASAIELHLDKCEGPENRRKLTRELIDLRTACYIVVASVSGCRNHELAFAQSDACYHTEGDNGEVYWWMRSQSTKTGIGHTEWMIPHAGVTALRVMDRWAKPYQAKIEEEILARRAIDPRDPEITEASRHVKAVFLGFAPMTGRARTLSTLAWNVNLKSFATQYGLDWDLASHQFRRKFANYAARSRFGDLRYLRDHFKHWSQDMTNGYALNDAQEMELYLEIEEELDNLKQATVGGWLQTDVPLAGGYGENLVAYRGSEEVKLFTSHAQMVKSIAESTSIRSNGHAWCTADDSSCVGNDIERTRCSGCNNAVIGCRHARVYQGLYDHLKEAAKCDDIGPGGLARVQRDMARCRRVLMQLGHDPEGEQG
jgi:integrase